MASWQAARERPAFALEGDQDELPLREIARDLAEAAWLWDSPWISQTCELLMYLDIGEAPRYLRRMKILVYSFLS